LDQDFSGGGHRFRRDCGPVDISVGDQVSTPDLLCLLDGGHFHGDEGASRGLDRGREGQHARPAGGQASRDLDPGMGEATFFRAFQELLDYPEPEPREQSFSG
jgi:hypothetical protein